VLAHENPETQKACSLKPWVTSQGHERVVKGASVMFGCWFRRKRSIEKVTHMQGFSKPMLGTKMTCGFIQRVRARAQRAILAQEGERSRDWEFAYLVVVGSLHQ
jgi:hypothetical protein